VTTSPEQDHGEHPDGKRVARRATERGHALDADAHGVRRLDASVLFVEAAIEFVFGLE